MLGFYCGGKFHFIVCLLYEPVAGEQTHLRNLAQRISDILYGATDGAHSLGTILFVGSWGEAIADIKIYNGSGGFPSVGLGRLWNWVGPINVWRWSVTDATLLAHEVAHYVYDVRDEYKYGENLCVDDVSTGYCLMETTTNTEDHGGWRGSSGSLGDYPDVGSDTNMTTFLAHVASGQATYGGGQPSRFCYGDRRLWLWFWRGNHDATTDSPQNNHHHGLACWETMVNDKNHGSLRYGLKARPRPRLPEFLVAPPWLEPPFELIPTDRYVLVFDPGTIGFPEQQAASRLWIDAIEAGRELAILSAVTSSAAVVDLAEVPQGGEAVKWREDRKRLVDRLESRGPTAFEGALSRALRTAVTGGVAAGQSLLLVGDGHLGAGDAAEELAQVVASFARVFTIGSGADQDVAWLHEVATVTGGTFFPVDSELDPELAARAVADSMIYLAGTLPERSQVATFTDSRAESVDAPPFRWRDAAARSAGWQDSELSRPSRFAVEISEGCERCTIGCYWGGSRFDAAVHIRGPGGAEVRRVRGAGYAFDVIEQPKGGTWEVEIEGAKPGDASLRIFGFQTHPRLHLRTSAVRPFVRPGDEGAVWAGIEVPEAVAGATVRAWVLGPGQDWIRADVREGAADRAEEGGYLIRFRTEPQTEGAYLVSVDAEHAGGEFEYTPSLVHRSAQTPPLPRQVKVPRFRLRTLLTIVADASGEYENKPLRGSNSRGPMIPDNQAELVAAWKRAHGRG